MAIRKRCYQALVVVVFLLLITVIGVLFTPLYLKRLSWKEYVRGSNHADGKDGVNISASVFFNPINQMVVKLKDKEDDLAEKERVIKQKEDRIKKERTAYAIAVFFVFIFALILCWRVVSIRCFKNNCEPKHR